MGDKTEELKQKLKSVGLSDEVVRAAWPQWWSDDAERSPSALNDLKFSVARRLGINPTSLFDEGDATFVWHGDAKFKGLSARSRVERVALNAFGISIARSLLLASQAAEYRIDYLADASNIRLSILGSGTPFVQLGDLVVLSWALGIPVIHLRVFPLEAKRMAAMTVRLGDRYAILLGRNSNYPASLAFILAHELGHIAHGHLSRDTSLIDQNMIGDKPLNPIDDEEIAADRFALTILTGRPEPIIEPTRLAKNSVELANAVKTAMPVERIDPGTLALCYAYKTGEWRIAQGALKILYSPNTSIWKQVNSAALKWLNLEQLSSDNAEFMHTVLGFS